MATIFLLPIDVLVIPRTSATLEPIVDKELEVTEFGLIPS
jgi:hypothetical protein